MRLTIAGRMNRNGGLGFTGLHAALHLTCVFAGAAMFVKCDCYRTALEFDAPLPPHIRPTCHDAELRNGLAPHPRREEDGTTKRRF